MTEEDLKRELALSLVAVIREGESTEAATAAISAADELVARNAFGELVLAAKKWKEAGGKPKNAGQFNDLMRALDAVTS